MHYNALDIAKYILNKYHNDNIYISNIRLQRILYLIQVEWLKRYDHVLFKDDIEAWSYGPVTPNVYYEYYGYGGLQIKETYPDFILQLEQNKLQLLDQLINDYKDILPWDLVTKSNRDGGSWSHTYKNHGRRMVIDISDIKEFDIIKP